MNLLTDEMFSTSAGSMSLPQVLAALSRGEAISFPCVREIQVQAWYCFLVQAAAFALDREKVDAPFTDAARWRDVLAKRTEGDDAWTLVVDDLSKPAFLQPPVPEGKMSALKDGPISTPDDSALEPLYSGRMHDLKPNGVTQARAEHWVYGLLFLQTTSGYGGRGNAGIVRMNGAYASRPMVSIAGTWGERFVRDLDAWKRAYDDPRAARCSRDGLAFTWVDPWKGETSYAMSDLHPAFIEVCRRVRLSRNDAGEIVAYRVATKSARIHGKELFGVTGDAWAPTKRDEDKPTSFTVKDGFHYRKVCELLFSGDWEAPPSLHDREELPQVIEFRALEGGQGKTAGFHLRRVLVPSIQFVYDGDAQHHLAERSQNQIDWTKSVASSVLRPAVAAILQGAPEKLDLSDDQIKPTLAEFDRLVDEQFFVELFRPIEQDSEHQLRFAKFLRAVATDVYERARRSLPVADGRRERSLAAGDGLFFGGLKKQLAVLFNDTDKDEKGDDVNGNNVNGNNADEEDAHV